MKSWSEMFPDGRYVYYEGKTPDAFVGAIKDEFGFDPSENNDRWNKKSGHCFFCPGKHMDKLYGGGKYPLGS